MAKFTKYLTQKTKLASVKKEEYDVNIKILDTYDILVKDYTISESGSIIIPAYQYKDEKFIKVAKNINIPEMDAKWIMAQIDQGKSVMLETEFVKTKFLSKRARTLADQRLNPQLYTQLYGQGNEIAPYAADDFADDEPNKYEKEKGDKKWDEVLIDKDGRKLTRRQIRNHYLKNADKIVKEIKGKPVMVYIGTGKNQNILKRNEKNKPIIINNKQDLMWWADRRLLSLHYVVGPKTKLGWVDLDIHGNYPRSKAASYAKKLMPVLKKELHVSPSLWFSAGHGLHIEFHFAKEQDTDKLREHLKEILTKFNEDYPDVTTGIVKGNGMRSDITTLHNKGNLRVEYSLGESVGDIKRPFGGGEKEASKSLSKLHKISMP